MASIKLTILLSLFLFAIYAEHDARRTVENLKLNRNQLNQGKQTTITTADEEFMKRALELSQLALKESHGHPFGSVVVKDGKIIGEGWNRTNLLKDPSAHAEVEAIRDACKKLGTNDLSGCTIYASAQPCPMCLSLIYLTGARQVYYCIPHSKIEQFNKDLSVDYIYDELNKSQTKRSVPEIQILSEHADEYLKSYSQ